MTARLKLLLPLCLASAWLFVMPLAAEAHPFDYGAIDTTLSVQNSTIRLHSVVPQSLSFSDAQSFFPVYFADRISIDESGKPCPFTLGTADTSQVDRTTFDGSFACPAPVASIDELSIKNALFSDYFTRFDDFVTLSLGGKEWELLFTQDAVEYPGSVAARPLGAPLAYFLAVAAHFLWLGMLHIWTGYDHILLINSIILVMRSVRDILLVVSSFTIAHSITLLLAGFHIVTLPDTLVEPAIALTIAYMALRNALILRKGLAEAKLGERWATTFGFGLIHGLGFAGALTATRIPSQFFTPALLIFNVGIEIGQLVILALAIPLLLWLDRQEKARAILMGGSGIILALAVVWFFERI